MTFSQLPSSSGGTGFFSNFLQNAQDLFKQLTPSQQSNSSDQSAASQLAPNNNIAQMLGGAGLGLNGGTKLPGGGDISDLQSFSNLVTKDPSTFFGMNMNPATMFGQSAVSGSGADAAAGADALGGVSGSGAGGSMGLSQGASSLIPYLWSLL